MNSVDDVLAAIADRSLLASGEPVVVGLSGGPDSVVLAHALRRAGHPVTAAHFDHALRPESAAEADVVAAWCRAWGLPLVIARAAVPPATAEAARDARYAFLATAAREVGVGVVATAHHRDDQAETVLLRLARGTGPDGLAGIPRERPLAPGIRLVRPLLPASRAAILTTLAAWALPALDDPGNRDEARARTRVRLGALPALAAVHPDAAAHLASLATLAFDERQLQARETARLARFLARPAGPARIEVDREAFNGLPAPVRRRLVRHWAAELDARAPDAVGTAKVLRAAERGGGASIAGGWSLRSIGPHLHLGRDLAGEARSIEPSGPQATHPWGWNIVAKRGRSGFADPCRVSLDDLSGLAWRLGRAASDWFQPAGHLHARTLSHYLARAGIPPSRRDTLLVLAREDTVLWVVGHAASARLLAAELSLDGVEMQATARFRV